MLFSTPPNKRGVFAVSKCVVLPVDIFAVEGLSIYDQMCYMVIRSFMNGKTKEAFPSYDTIAKLGRMSKRKAIDCVKVLVEKGLLKKESRPSGEGKKDNTSNVYQFPSERHAQSSDCPASSSEQKDRKTYAHHAPKQKDYKHLLTNKNNNSRIAPLPSYILNQPKEDHGQCTEEQKNVLAILLDKLDKEKLAI
jgi:hypothetical protein